MRRMYQVLIQKGRFVVPNWSFADRKRTDYRCIYPQNRIKSLFRCIGQVVEGFLELLAGIGNKTRFIRCDNAGENTKWLKNLCNKYGIIMEHTAPYTPQQNGVVERGFVTLQECAMAIMFSANFTPEYQSLL